MDKWSDKTILDILLTMERQAVGSYALYHDSFENFARMKKPTLKRKLIYCIYKAVQQLMWKLKLIFLLNAIRY